MSQEASQPAMFLSSSHGWRNRSIPPKQKYTRLRLRNNTITWQTWQYIVCFPNLRKSLVLVNSRIQGSDYDDDDDGRWGVGKGEWFKSGHGLCPMSDPNPLASRIMWCGISELFPFLCGTSTFYNDAPAAGQTNQAWWQGLDQRVGIGTHGRSIRITLHLLELYIWSGRKSLPLYHINAAWLYSS